VTKKTGLRRNHVARGSDVEDELNEFVAGRYLALRRTAYLLCGDWHRAEDLVQGALIKVVVAARRRRVDSLDAYSRQVLLNLFLEENRRLWRKREKPWPDVLDIPVFDGDSTTKIAIFEALGSLPPRQRAAVVLRYWEDRSVEERAPVDEGRNGSPELFRDPRCDLLRGAACSGRRLCATRGIPGRQERHRSRRTRRPA
jgi:RNA polymerase sigma factor (sigma-70 family)